ncbi:hypothetical protein [Klebsiella pneumoniae]|uniref:hypothetical protein n=1 Tax=Klebsiella TaxID=570 RepID=UPI000EFCA8DB|nr:hypothetical protein [Klebsiella pneumoniae]AYO66743.1 hypothetical protein DA795_06765 [Klebsiella pneumoniae]
MNIETVNEIIASLESAGELSIREQKFLKLAKAHVQLAAENVTLKSYRDTLDEIKSSLVGGGHGHMAKADMQAQGALLDVIFDAFDDIETPATDRIVAEAEARGVEKAIVHLEKKFSNIAVQIMNLQWLADSLREGAK